MDRFERQALEIGDDIIVLYRLNGVHRLPARVVGLSPSKKLVTISLKLIPVFLSTGEDLIFDAVDVDWDYVFTSKTRGEAVRKRLQKLKLGLRKESNQRRGVFQAKRHMQSA